MENQHHSSPLPYCFKATPTTTKKTSNPSNTAAPPPPTVPSLATTLYQTESAGLFALTWSRSLLTRSLHINVLLGISSNTEDALSNLGSKNHAFSLHFKPFFFWCKHGSKKLNLDDTAKKSACVFWDFSKAKFGTGLEPQSGYFVAVVIDREMALLVGDLVKEAYGRTKARMQSERSQSLVLRREHVHGNKFYRTKADFGGQERELSIDCRGGDDPRLYFCVDSKRVLKIKHLKWKFRGNERIEVDGVSVQVSWDVYNWLFEDDEEGYALFTFRFDKKGFVDEDNYFNNLHNNGMIQWSQQSFGLGFETKKMKKGLLKSGRSSTSSSFSSASSSSSVMEWASLEENELKGPSGFSLMVYAWKS
ncbi:hypothetical protein Leryth_012072 [Lithospermum erythrorhizon]|nr:hypothetical protein Leryth_012072 [Lithospermum erythrorhizon]